MEIKDKTEAERLDRAKRVRQLRAMTKLSRRAFARKTGIANATLQHWEDGNAYALPEKSIKRLIKALLTLGIHCSYEWLIHGEGADPQYISSIPTSIEAANSSKQIEEELAVFLQQDKHAVSFIVPDDAMEPRFTAGEVVAGINVYGEDIKELIGLECIVLIQGGDIHLRTILQGDIEGYYNLTHTNPKTTASKPFFYNVELVSAAPVTWARRII